MPLAAGQTLSHYEILAPLGAGAMGEVYRAKDTRLEREVAIKVLPAHFADDEERVRRFEREARLLASLNHPNVAQIFGVDLIEGRWFLVLELVPGETLEDRLDRGALPVDERQHAGDRGGPAARHPALHGSRAGARSADRPPCGHLGLRVRGVRVSDRVAGLRRPDGLRRVRRGAREGARLGTPARGGAAAPARGAGTVPDQGPAATAARRRRCVAVARRPTGLGHRRAGPHRTRAHRLDHRAAPRGGRRGRLAAAGRGGRRAAARPAAHLLGR